MPLRVKVMGVTANSGIYIKDFKHWKCIHRIKITSGYNIMSKGVQLFLIFNTYIKNWTWTKMTGHGISGYLCLKTQTKV